MFILYFKNSSMKNINTNVDILHCIISNNKNKKAFTLVELIIVITILAILATIAFASFQNFTKDARDWNRITTLKNIESGLILYNIKTNKYPDPEEYVEILSWNILLIKQWIVWNDVSQKIKLNKEALDPKDKTNYIYSITWNGKKYQLWTYLEENKLISYIPQIAKTYAIDVNNIDYTNRYFYTIWNKVWILLEEQTQKPILKTQTLTWINLETNTGSYVVYFSNDTQSWSYTNSWTELIPIIKENQKTTQTIKEPNNCLFDGRVILSWQSVEAYETPSVPHGNTCNKQIRTCNDSTLSWSFTFADCSIEWLTCPIDQYSENWTTCTNVWIWYYSENWATTRTACTNKPANFTYTTSWNGTNSCEFTCDTSDWYYWDTCEKREVYWDEDQEAIDACNKWVQDAIWTSAWWYQNWIWVPANPANNGNFTTDWTWTTLTDDFYKRTTTYNWINYTCKWFAVMKYEAKIVWNNVWTTTYKASTMVAESRASWTPWVNINQAQAIDECRALWTWYHLNTNNEWMTIARNIEANSQNWSWTVLNSWHNDNNPSNALAASTDDNDGYTGTLNSSWNQKRTHTLSNWQVIWDLAWNVWEHVNRWNDITATSTDTEKFTWDGTICWASWHWHKNWSPSTTCWTTQWPINIAWWSNIGMWYVRHSTDNTGRIFFRGGGWSSNISAGVFTMNLTNVADSAGISLGFRCAF